MEKKFGVNYSFIECVCLEEGIIYPDKRPIADIPKPIQVMVGNPDRKVLTNVAATEPDMITEDVSEPRIKMSCGHAISKNHKIFRNIAK